MSDIIILIFGCLVSSLVLVAVVLLTWGVSMESRSGSQGGEIVPPAGLTGVGKPTPTRP